MSVWSSIIGKLKGLVNKMIGSRTVENTLHVTPIISLEMERAINLWNKMYKGEAPWIHEPTDTDPTRVVSLELPALIASEKARTALLEFNSEITTPAKEVEVENPEYKEPEPDEFGNILPVLDSPIKIEEKPVGKTDRAEFLESQYKKLKKQLRRQLEYGIAKGGLVIKPYLVANNLTDNNYDYQVEFDFIQADCFYPLAFDSSGNITEAAFIDSQIEKDIVYRRLEYHKWENNSITVINKAFKSTIVQGQENPNDLASLGKEVELSEVSTWKDLQPEITIKDVQKPLFAYFKMPEANTIDITSPLGVSGFSRAVNLIKDADMQYSRLLWEYEAGEMAVDIDRDAMNFQDNGQGGQTVANHLQARLFRKVDLGESDTYMPYAPSLRDGSFLTGLNNILMRIEDVTGLSRGTLSDAASEARTATELKILKQRSYQTNADIQQALEDALRDVIYIMNVYCDLYEVTAPGEYDVNFEWDDSIIVDVDAELGKRITLLQNGLTSKQEVRMWYFGETERQAQEALLGIEKEGMQDMENELAVESNKANIAMQAKAKQ